ncbi:hypothetical protein LINPERHAP1_LOCUS28271, partial [Linum perenne]
MTHRQAVDNYINTFMSVSPRPKKIYVPMNQANEHCYLVVVLIDE